MSEGSSVKNTSKKIKRTSFSPWSSGVMKSNSKPTGTSTTPPSVLKHEPDSPEPPRIVSDIVPLTTVGGLVPDKPSMAELSTHPRIREAQLKWEKHGGTSKQSVDSASEGSISDKADVTLVKRSAVDAVSGPSSNKKHKISHTPVPCPQIPGQNSKGSISNKLGVSPASAGTSSPQPSRNVLGSAVQTARASLPHKIPWKDWPPTPRGERTNGGTVAGPSIKSSVTSVRPEVSRTSSSTLTAPALNSLRAEARRFSEAAVEDMTNEITGKPEPPTLADKRSSRDLAAECTFRNKIDGAWYMNRFVKDDMKKDNPVVTVGPRKGETLVPLLTATETRPYTLYEAPDGSRMSSRGVLIPDKYELHDDSRTPFVCPVRDCRRLFKNLSGLGGHWGASHYGKAFNDNGDGTLSFICAYTNLGPAGAPGIVISTEPLSPNAPAANIPSLSYWGQLKLAKNSHGQQATRSTRPDSPEMMQEPRIPPRPIASPQMLAEDASEVKAYLHAHLKKGHRFYKREDVRQMIALPRKRDLPASWISYHGQGELDATHYTLAIAYLTGEEVTGPEACHTYEKQNSRPTARLSVPCIRVPEELTRRGRKLFSSLNTCVGCRYYSHLQRQKNLCDWADPDDESWPGPINYPVSYLVSALPINRKASESSATELESAPSVDSETSKSVPEPNSVPESRHTRLSSARSPDSEEPTAEPRPKRHVAAPISYRDSLRARKEPANTETTETTGLVRPTLTAEETPGVQQAAPRPDQFDRSRLEMEDWEVAPGRLTNQASQNVAFSNSYLTTGAPVAVSDDISFNVEVVKPGASQSWTPESAKIRTMSVAAGKVNVTVNDKTFPLGPNGMFVVRAGETCKVENRLYFDAVVHCTTILEF